MNKQEVSDLIDIVVNDVESHENNVLTTIENTKNLIYNAIVEATLQGMRMALDEVQIVRLYNTLNPSSKTEAELIMRALEKKIHLYKVEPENEKL